MNNHLGRAPLVILVGEPEFGKTRTAQGFVAATKDRGTRVIADSSNQRGNADRTWCSTTNRETDT